MSKRKSQEIGAWFFGGLTFAFMGAVFWFKGAELSPTQHKIAGLFGALMAGFFGFFLTGNIKIRGDAQVSKRVKLGIQAGGGMALFALVLFWWNSDAGPIHVRQTIGNVKASEGSSIDIGQKTDTPPSESNGAAPVEKNQEIGDVEASGKGSVNIRQQMNNAPSWDAPKTDSVTPKKEQEK